MRLIEPIASESSAKALPDEVFQLQTQAGFVTGVLYHGTNQPINEFSRDRLGQSTRSFSSYKAFFFTDDPGCAAAYAMHATRSTVASVEEFESKRDELQKNAERLEAIARRTGDWDAYEKAYEAYENCEMDAIREPEGTGACVYPVRLIMKNPLVVDMADRIGFDSVDTLGVVNKAQADGHDGVVIKNISDTPGDVAFTCTHIAVFNPNQIQSIFHQESANRFEAKKKLDQPKSKGPTF